MKFKQSLVYNKNELKIVGFVNLGEVNDQLAKFEREASNDTEPSCGEVATHILTLMFRGIFFRLRFPYAHFPTTGITGDFIFLIVWEAVERLERLGFKVLVITADGASANRKFFRMHHNDSKDDICYKTKNPYAKDERNIFRVRCTTSKEKGAKLLVSFLWPWKYKEAMGRYRSLDSCVAMCLCVCFGCTHNNIHV